MIAALNHRIRRSALRTILEKGSASSKEIRENGMSTSEGGSLNFHLEYLVDRGAVVRDRKRVGYKESFYSPTAALNASWVQAALKLTAAEDE